MRKSRIHREGDCGGTLERIYRRPAGGGSLEPIGYQCDLCGAIVEEDTAVERLAQLRPAVESVAAEITALLADLQVHERFAGIVRESPDLLQAGQSNPFLQGVRRWWAVYAAIMLRRHADGGRRESLRDIAESLVNLPDSELTRPRDVFASYIKTLEEISDRFRPYLNAVIYGGAVPLQSAVTFNDLNHALKELGEVTAGVYAAVVNISRATNPTIIDDWTSIFRKPWLSEEQAYPLGAEGVPFDAMPMSKGESDRQAELDLRIHVGEAGWVTVEIVNVGKSRAIDARLFLPYARTVIDVEKLDVGDSAMQRVRPQLAVSIYGQAVLEFSDSHDHAYRQYADVNLPSGMVRKLSSPAYRVTGRIVASSLEDGMKV